MGKNITPFVWCGEYGVVARMNGKIPPRENSKKGQF